MLLHPTDASDKLEYHKVLQHIASYTQGQQGKEILLHPEWLTDKATIERKLTEVEEWLSAIVRTDSPPFGAYESIDDDLFLLSKDGYVLDIESIQRIHHTIRIAYDLYFYFRDYTRQKSSPHLFEICNTIHIDPNVSKEIIRIIDEEGNIRPNASAALQKISKTIENKEREIDKVFRSEIDKFKTLGFLAENMESMRNGRRVLTSAAEHKRKISGIIHDESATGKMVYIEPEATIHLNNEIASLYTERKAEIYKIIRELCHFIRPHHRDIKHASSHIIALDVIRAKAQYARKVGAKKPQIVDKPKISIADGYNPALFLKLEQSGEKIVTFDLELYPPNKLFVLSGPNAGGKSVALKSVGLLQLMVQSGILPTVHENSKFGIFEKIFVDIGDQQSLEDDLSTYSSHLQNMKKVLEESDAKSLVLIDEFGAGTDPKIGGAIAEAILHDIHHKSCYGVITTHYSNLKFYAYKMKGVVNGCMEFDKNGLRPTFKLHVGRPGSSFAFEIAEKIGLPESVIDNARKKSGKNENALEDMLVDLQTEKRELETKMSILLEKEERIDRLTSNYNNLHSELEYQRKKLKLEKKEANLYESSKQTKELQKLIKELKSTKDIEKAEVIIKEQKIKEETILQNVKQLKDEVHEKVIINEGKITVDSNVRIRNSETVGKILSIEKDRAELEVGFLKIFADIKDLIPTKEPIEVNRKKTIDTSKVSGIGQYIETKLDIRGYKLDDAMWFLQEFIERGLMNNAFELKIIHGIGNGILKKNVQRKLREYKDVKEIWHPEEEYGGEGVTYVKF